MSVTDPIADMLTLVRNASRANKPAVEVKASKMAEEIVRIMKEEGFIKNYKKIEDKKQGLIKVYLKYFENKTPAITGLKKITKPGLRKYIKKDQVRIILGGVGISVISTSSGVLTDKQCREKGIGGEVICEIW